MKGWEEPHQQAVHAALFHCCAVSSLQQGLVGVRENAGPWALWLLVSASQDSHPPSHLPQNSILTWKRQFKLIHPLLGSPKRKAVNHCHHTPLLGHVPRFYFSLFCIIIIGLISKENKSIFTRERRHPQKAKIMTVCSLQETLIKLDLPSVQASASFQEELWCEAERRGSPFQATCGQQRD